MSEPAEAISHGPDRNRFRLGEWFVQPAEGTLCSGERSVRLEPRVMDVLVHLAANSGRVVSKEELLVAVWGGTFVEEGALSQAIHGIRKALGDDARQPRFIQTIPKRGYRLVAAVEPGLDSVKAETEGDLAPLLESPIASTVSVFKWGPRERLLIAMASVVVSLVLWIAWTHRGTEKQYAEQVDTKARNGIRIVVLPFENLGKSEDDFFAAGLTEEITKDLASIQSLEVISRTTSILYKGTRKPLSQIGRELDVDYVLEGTVRWARKPQGWGRVRIIPQLIRVSDDTHVWADAYEKEVEDIFKVQAEISRSVIEALGITLLRDEPMPRSQPTSNLDAFWAYARGLQLKNQPIYSEEYLRKAVPMFERAVDLDPGFAAAWAELSQTHSYLAFNSDRSPARVEKARQALERAMTLAPELLEVRLAQVYYTYRCLRDFDTALEQLTTISRLFPKNAEVLRTLGYVLRRKGQLGQAIEVLKDTLSLDPRASEVVWTIADTYHALRNYRQADFYYGQAISLAPDEASFWAERAWNRLAWTGELEEARAILKEARIPESPVLAAVAFQLDFYERKYLQALRVLSSEQLRRLPLQDQSQLATLAAIAYERLGDPQRAREAAEANRSELEARTVRFPTEPQFRAYLAVALAQIGRKAEAIEQIEKAVNLASHDVFTDPRIIQIQAMMEAILGHRREAIERLAVLLDTPYRTAICTAELRLSPVWDPLRDDPAFENLLRRDSNIELDRVGPANRPSTHKREETQ